MQDVPGGAEWPWSAFAERGVLFTFLTSFILALATRRLAWWYQITERDERIKQLETKNDKLEAENKEMQHVLRANAETVTKTVDALDRALDKLEEPPTGAERRKRP